MQRDVEKSNRPADKKKLKNFYYRGRERNGKRNIERMNERANTRIIEYIN